MLKRFIAFLSSVKLAVILIALIALCCIAATFMKQIYADKYIYHSFWFLGMLGLFTANLILCTLKKLKWSRKLPGFFFSHFGIMVIIAGAAVSALYGESGFISLREGQVVDSFYTLEEGVTYPLGYKLKLNDFRVEFYPPKLIFTEQKKITGSHEAVAGKTYAAGDGKYSFKIEEIHRDASMEGPEKECVKVITGNREKVFPAELGGKYEIDNNVFLDVFEKYRDFRRKDEDQAGMPPDNPALHVKLSGPEGIENRWLFSLYPDFNKGHGQKVLYKGIRILYEREDLRGPTAKIRVIGPDGEKVVTLYTLQKPFYQYTKDMFVGYQWLSSDVKSYESHVAILDKSGERTALIKVNHPLTHGKYRLYQSGYRENDLTWTSLQVRYDPGTPFVYLGFIFVCFGLLYSSFIYPALVKRKK